MIKHYGKTVTAVVVNLSECIMSFARWQQLPTTRRCSRFAEPDSTCCYATDIAMIRVQIPIILLPYLRIDCIWLLYKFWYDYETSSLWESCKNRTYDNRTL